jgi:hypothetical protein
MTDFTTTRAVPAEGWKASAVSWPAIIAGAVAAGALTAALLILGTAFGFATFSPFLDEGLSLTTIGIVTVIWLVFVQLAASALGGYLTGRLRIRWSINPDEVFFRDTAHGLLAWALSTVLVFAVFGGGIAATGAVGAQAATAAAALADEDDADPMAYLTDRLYRGASPAETVEARAETRRIFARWLAGEQEGILADDRDYLVALVSAESGVGGDEAAARVDAALNDVREAEQEARERSDEIRAAGATLSIVTFLALLVGAFTASVAAVYGGRERDGLEDAAITP